MGLAYERLAETNRRLIYASISGFGITGSQRERTAFDIIAQATAGIMDALGLPNRPPGVFFADLVSGAYAAMAIAFALFAREKTGKGQRIDISMQDVMYAHHFKAHSLQALGESAAPSTETLGPESPDKGSESGGGVCLGVNCCVRSVVDDLSLTHWRRSRRVCGVFRMQGAIPDGTRE